MEKFVPINPTPRQLELINLIIEMHTDYDNGLREFQEAIHYAVYHMFVNNSKHCRKKDAVNYILYLRDLANRLRAMEELMNQPG